MQVKILYHDRDIAVVWKPPGLLVHPSNEAPDTYTLMHAVRNALSKHVFPVHRLDRQTSGLVVFGLTSEAAGLLSQQFRDKSVNKGYLALVRGFFPVEPVFLDRPVKPKREKTAFPAQTNFNLLYTCVHPWHVSRYEKARFSLVFAKPVSGRRHQIRKHLAHLRHPIIGDRMYGDRHHNKLFDTKFGWHRMLLSAVYLQFKSPCKNMIHEFYCIHDEHVIALAKTFFGEDKLDSIEADIKRLI